MQAFFARQGGTNLFANLTPGSRPGLLSVARGLAMGGASGLRSGPPATVVVRRTACASTRNSHTPGSTAASSIAELVNATAALPYLKESKNGSCAWVVGPQRCGYCSCANPGSGCRLDLHHSLYPGRVVTEAAPLPIFWVLYQPALHRIAVRVAQLLNPLALGPDIEIVIAEFPEAGTPSGVGAPSKSRCPVLPRFWVGRGSAAPPTAS